MHRKYQIEISTGLALIQFTTEELTELARICDAAPADDLEALRFTKFFIAATVATEAFAQADLAGQAAVAQRLTQVYQKT